MSLMRKKMKAMYIAQGIGLTVIGLSIYCQKKAVTPDDHVVCHKAMCWGTGLFVHATLIVAGVNTVRLVRKVLK